MSNFSCSLTRNTTSQSMKNLDFHSLSEFIILPILTTSFRHPSLKGRENVLFELRSSDNKAGGVGVCGETLRCQLKIDQGGGSAERKSDS